MKSHPLHLRPNTAKNKERKKLGRPILAPMSSSLWYISTKFLFLTPFFLLLSICVCWFGSWTLQAYKACACQLQGWRARSQQQRLSVWQAGTWDLCCNVCTWTNVSSNNIIQRNCKGLNVTAWCTVQANSGQKYKRSKKKKKTQQTKNRRVLP